jgi:hypothetical protein
LYEFITIVQHIFEKKIAFEKKIYRDGLVEVVLKPLFARQESFFSRQSIERHRRAVQETSVGLWGTSQHRELGPTFRL